MIRVTDLLGAFSAADGRNKRLNRKEVPEILMDGGRDTILISIMATLTGL